MLKKPLQDVVPPPKKSIRQIIVPRENAGEKDEHKSEKPKEQSEQSVAQNIIKSRISNNNYKSPIKNISMKETKISSKRIWIIAILLIGLIYFASSFIFSGASISITPRAKTVVLDAIFTSMKNGGAMDLTYQTMSLSQEKSEELTATGEKFIETKASGKIIVYNDFSKSPQRLIKNTRFMSADGLIFRIPEPIIVPGSQEKNGKIIPGELTTEVKADFAGAEYNIGTTKFTLPGLKGDERFDHIYAESNTAMTNGFSGKIKMVNPEEEDSARSEMSKAIEQELASSVENKIPEGFILYPDAISFSQEALPSTPVNNTNENNVLINHKVTLRAVIFNKFELSKYIARSTIANFDEKDVIATNLNDLNFQLLEKDNLNANLDTNNPIKFSLKGSPSIEWTFNQERLLEDLAGKPKSMINTVLSAYPGIESLEPSIKPFWSRSFPKNPLKIKLNIVYK